MPMVINDGDEVRRFASRVLEARREVSGAAHALEEALRADRVTWRDARAEEAERRIGEALVEMRCFTRDAEATEIWLRELAVRIDKYHHGA